MHPARWDVLGIGNSAVDELLFLDRFPAPESKVPLLHAERQGGGLAATALVTAARQGAKAAFCSKLGRDELSTFTLQDLQNEGVDCSPCFRAPEGGVPYHAYILVDRQDHTRTILYRPGDADPPPEHITAELVSGCRVLLIDHHAPAAGARAARLAHNAGIPVVSDLESDRALEFAALLDLSDHLILGLAFARRITGLQDIEEVTASLASSDRPAAVVTAGDQGCWFCQRGGPPRHFPAFAVDVVDTTGCGDVFHGAYAAALARGESVEEAIAAATASAALKATKPGGRAGIPDLPTVRQFLQRNGHGPVGSA